MHNSYLSFIESLLCQNWGRIREQTEDLHALEVGILVAAWHGCVDVTTLV